MAREVAWVGPASAVESVRVVQAAVVQSLAGGTATNRIGSDGTGIDLGSDVMGGGRAALLCLEKKAEAVDKSKKAQELLDIYERCFQSIHPHVKRV